MQMQLSFLFIDQCKKKKEESINLCMSKNYQFWRDVLSLILLNLYERMSTCEIEINYLL